MAREAYVCFNVGSLGNSSAGNEPLGHPCKAASELVAWSTLY